MADPNWRGSPPPSGTQRPGGAATNGTGGPFRGGRNDVSLPASKSVPAFSPPGQPIQAALGTGIPLSSSSARLGGPPSTAGLGPPSSGSSPFSASSSTGMPPAARRVSSPPLAGPPSYGSGSSGYGGAPNANATIAASGMRAGGPPISSNGPPAISRKFSPPPPPLSSQSAFAKPSMTAPPTGPPRSWSGHGNGNGNGNGTAGVFPPGGVGPNGQQQGQKLAYGAPPSFAPPMGPPSSGNGVGPGSSGGQGGYGGASMARVPSMPAGVYGGGQGAAPPMSAPGQYQGGYSNGGMPASATAPRPKINPEQIPRPIVGGEPVIYRTCTPPTVKTPPTPTSNYVALDEGNCSPRFMRSTMAQLPMTADAMGACKIPMAVTVQPMAIVGPEEIPVNLVDFGEAGPLRCEMCRAYINSFAKYVQNGEKWICNFCKHEGPVPHAYQCPLDGAGLRRDRDQRAELCRGSVDFVVPKTVYCLRPEQQPIFVFCVDVSPRALETGFSAACLAAIEASLDSVPGGERARVGVMTFDKCLQVYRVDEEGNVSQMAVAPDTENGRQTTPASACASGAALRATVDCLDGIGGRVFLMAQSPADVGAGAVSRGREEGGLYGGDKEFRMYQPAPDVGKDVAAVMTGVFYKALAKDCAARQVCVDLMLWSNGRVREFYDAGTIGMVSRVTGGRVTCLRGGEPGDRDTESHLREQLTGALRDHAYSASEAILKVRCTAGFSCTQRLGPGVENMPGELEVANITPHHTIVCRLEHDGRKLEEGGMVYVQSALLYTSTSGQRRVRCHTLGLPVTGLLPNIFRSTDVETVSAVMARQAVSRALGNKMAVEAILKQVEESMLAMLFAYRKKCASDSPAGQLILPEALRVLPLFTLCAHKMLALRPNSKGGAPDVRADERAARLLANHSLSVEGMVKVLYPSLYSVHDLPPDIGDAPPPRPPPPAAASEPGAVGAGVGLEGVRGVEGIWGSPRSGVDVPPALPPTSEKLSSSGVFLLDNGEELLLYVGRSVSREVMSELFAVDAVPGPSPPGYGNEGASASMSVLHLRQEDGYEQARRVRNVIEQLRRGSAAHKPLVVVVANSGVPEEARFVSLMVEDKTKHGTSYVDELCNLHHKIQSRMG
ncbi:unnamed protein product [Ectocarpus fasciculatus]